MAATLTFPIPYGPTVNAATRGTQTKILRAEFGDGYNQRAADGIHNVRDSYVVAWENITHAEASACDTFLRNRGGHESFLWTPPGGLTPRQWICTEWQVRHTTATMDSLSATFVEVFDQ